MALDQAAFLVNEVPIFSSIIIDLVDSILSEAQDDGLQTLDDYSQLYDVYWKGTLLEPLSPTPGRLTNYTQDLLFSMERLSLSPYQVKRLDPSLDTLQFSVEDSLAINITGMTLPQLLQDGRLFYADYRGQMDLVPTDRYSAACDAFFYIDQTSTDFLPLAIRTNQGSSLIYTPRDEPNDWLLAKIMYNVNDFWFAQWNHLAGTHEVVQIVYLAAIRTLSDDHPILALLDRLTYEIYAIQPLAEILLFLPGAAVDQLFPYTGLSAQNYTTYLYQNGSGRFRTNYFERNLEFRGLINCPFGPALKSFPFFEDASVIYSALKMFMTSFINSYYDNDTEVIADEEIQGWVRESRGPAEVIDFPQVTTRSGLVDILTQIVSVKQELP
ncbi:hypothetical protein AYL99_11894 [Fonsecaea erecta]|uniref:Manganese lipoxygenase n=1 Tax=Fonsecaea erecta TaxID=1367422 RepID=A0A178Z249_9EURO|nr:hypothetical protein AYL99_11894 [Fonsecaea erecta]OAP53872.1 hypothetical protein AYL99_11894 [Fonsecaea erecta]